MASSIVLDGDVAAVVVAAATPEPTAEETCAEV